MNSYIQKMLLLNKEMIRTKSQLALALKYISGRGTYDSDSNLGVLSVRVPIWKVKPVKVILHETIPLGFYINVNPLSFWDHFTLWSVKEL